MDLARGYRAKNGIKSKFNEFHGVGIGPYFDTLLIIKLPDSRVLRIMSRSLFLAMVLMTLPSIGSIIGGCSMNSIYEPDVDFDPHGLKMLPNLFRNLVEEGLLKKEQKGLIISSDVSGAMIQFNSLNVNDIDLVIESNLNNYKNSKNVIQNEAFDFVLLSSFQDPKAIDRIVKTGGIVVSQLSNYPSSELQLLANYRLVYLRRFDHTIVAMRKIGSKNGFIDYPSKRTLCGITPEDKKAALRGLEDTLLEPPRKALAESSNGSRKIKFLPDLLKDSLKSYPRRIFISSGTDGAAKWFTKNYPTRNQEFEVYNMEIEMYDADITQKVEHPRIEFSNWLTNNVREEDYVVMKAEAVVVEEMIKGKTICLVDELFLECENQWEDGKEENSRKRAYWQCLALYGKLRDDGVAVHQWWS